MQYIDRALLSFRIHNYCLHISCNRNETVGMECALFSGIALFRSSRDDAHELSFKVVIGLQPEELGDIVERSGPFLVEMPN